MKPQSTINIPRETLTELVKAACEFTGASASKIQTKTRKKEVVLARQVLHYFLKQNTTASLQEIGNQIGNKDHASVLHSIKTINNLCETSKSFASRFDQLQEKMKHILSMSQEKLQERSDEAIVETLLEHAKDTDISYIVRYFKVMIRQCKIEMRKMNKTIEELQKDREANQKHINFLRRVEKMREHPYAQEVRLNA
jgi:hypothetical protein